MRFPSWLRSLVARPNRTPARRAPRRPTYRPRLEALEDRLTPSGGLLDPTFGSGGVVNLPSATDNEAMAVAVQPDGKVVIAGYVARSRTGYSSISVQRLNPDGSLDATFNKTGSVTIQTGNDDIPRAVALQPDGKILVGGSWSSNNGSGGLVARLNANGTLDSTFGSKGLWLSTAAGRVNALAVLTDPAHPATVTGIVAADNASANGVGCLGAVKLTPGGQPDKTFGSGGVAAFANLTEPGDRRTAGVAVAPSGEIYLAGYVQFGSMTTNDGCVAAVTPAGKLDTTFGGGAGYVLAVPAGNQESEFYDVAVQTLTVNGQPVSRIVAAGNGPDTAGNNSGLVAAYTLSGALDTTFGSGGSFTYTNPSAESSWLNTLALEADGSIVVGGAMIAYDAGGALHQGMLAGHLTADGAVDASFGPDGTGFTYVRDGQGSEIWGLAIDPTDGDILLSGLSINPGVVAQAAVLRLTAP